MNHKHIVKYTLFLISVTLAIVAYPLSADDEDDDNIDYSEWAIEDLLQVRIVTSVGKKEQSLANAPAAVYVVTSQEIKRSGVTTIADALRMVPGLHVAKTNAHTWAISSRGFNDFFSNKLLVLVDGRSVYTPEFSGVWWDTVDTVLDDIDRIEVIRGPGSTLWGANAVNGVINIITKHAKDTQGGLLSIAAGNEEQNITNLRYGGMLDEATETYFRVYTKLLKRDAYANSVANDEWHSTQAGFRIDGQPFSKDNKWMLQVNAYRAKEQDIHWLTNEAGVTDAKGFHILSSLEHQFSEDSTLTTQTYYSEYQRKLPVVSSFNKVFDLDIQHRYAVSKKHELMWGLGFRWLYNKMYNNDYFFFDEEKRIDNLFSAFVQDEIKLSEKHTLTIGTKLEHNDYTGWEIQPNIRYLWTPNDKFSLWGAISRATRTPSRRGHDASFAVSLPQSQNPFYPTDLVSQYINNPNVKSEEVLAYELGLHNQVTNKLSWDLALFFNNYDTLASARQFVTPDLANNRIFVTQQMNNDLTGDTYGLEVNSNYRPTEDLSFNFHYSYIKMSLDMAELPNIVDSAKELEALSPEHQFSLLMSANLSESLRLNTWVRYVSTIKRLAVNPEDVIKYYTTVDLNLIWSITEDLELSLVGQNLFDKQYREYFPNRTNPLYGEVERSFYGQIRWEF
ncbi:TonB-dependent receptor [Candidatus Albibeggiatoa sp. nov. NOAA]|uniref:TonB-dependent receptor plug domain-containing protein n=1 Tax=Candidatus Albibeggiatoa sp. nov. NOAA TaxID=3162724 RepID=UPI0032F5626C|nr:TonB-dependent receptor [Thiotrichaceae bacterium]